MSNKTTLTDANVDPLALAVQQSGLELESAQSLHLAFAPLFAQAEDWRLKVANIRVTDVSQVREMKLARESRLALREIRIKAEDVRKRLKEDSLRKGKAIDGVANVLKYLIEPLEESLLAQEKFAERQEAQRKSEMKVKREEQLHVFGIDTTFYDLGEMTEESYQQLLGNTISAHDAKKEAIRKAELERITREKAEAEERERIRLENEKLKREAVEREAAAKVEREKLEAAAAAERKIAAARAAEERKKSEAAALKAKQERDVVEAKAAEERKARERLEADIKRKSEQEAQRKAAEANAQRKAALAPDRDKLKVFASKVRTLELPEFSSSEGKAVLAELTSQVFKFADWIEKKANTL